MKKITMIAAAMILGTAAFAGPGCHWQGTRIHYRTPAYNRPAPPPGHRAPAYRRPAPPPRHRAPAYNRPAPPPRQHAPAHRRPAPPPRRGR